LGFRGENDSKQFKLLDGMECPILSQTPMGVCSSHNIWMHVKASVAITIVRLCQNDAFWAPALLDLWIDHASTHFKGIRRDCARNLADHVKPQISKLQTQPQNVIEMFQRHARHSQPTNKNMKIFWASRLAFYLSNHQ